MRSKILLHSAKFFGSIMLFAIIFLSITCSYLMIRHLDNNDDGNVNAIGASKEYAIKKIDEISDRIIKRKAVEESYFYFIREDEDLINSINDYNDTTGFLTGLFTAEAISIITAQCALYDEDETPIFNTAMDYGRIPAEIHELIDLLVYYMLQKNGTALIYSDSRLEQITALEAGGSYGMWPIHIRQCLHTDDTTKAEYDDYLILAEKIISQLDDYRKAMVY